MSSENENDIDSGKITPAKIAELKEMVEYSPGSIVSRTIHKNSAGNITIFAFDAGQSLSEHTAPFDALVYVLEGSGKVFIDGESNILGAGDIIMMPADVPHSIRAPQKFKMMLIMIRGE